MIAKIFRYNPAVDQAPYYQDYDVPVDGKEHITIMALLEHIAENLDGTLSFFSHSACLHGICGRCVIKCNGKVCLACQTVLNGEDIVLEPAKKDVVKDLVVRT